MQPPHSRNLRTPYLHLQLDLRRAPPPSMPPRNYVHVVVVVGTVVVVVGAVVVVLGTVVVVVVGGTVVVVGGRVVVVVVVRGTVVVVVGGRVVVALTVVVVVLRGRVVVVVGGRVGVVVIRVAASGNGALAGDVATGGRLSVASSALPGNDGIGVRDDALLRRNGGRVVVVVTTTFAVVVVVLLVLVVGTVVLTFTRWTKSVGGAESDAAKPHTTPVTASTATTSATPGCQTPSR